MKPFKKPLHIILLVTFVEVLAYAAILPFLPFHAQDLGASPITIGIIFATYSLFQLLVSPLLGKLSDKFGRKPVLVVGQLGTLVGLILLGLSNTVFLIFISRLIDGITGGNQTASYAAVTDVTDEKTRAQAFGYMGSGLGLGLLVGPALGALLMHFGFPVLVFCAAGLCLISIAITLIWLPETRRTDTAPLEPKRATAFLRLPAIKVVLVQIFFATLALNTFIFGFSLFAQKQLGYDTQAVGYAFAFMGFVGILFQASFISPLITLWGQARTILIGHSCLVVGFILLIATRHTLLLPVSLSVIMLGTVLTGPILGSFLTKLVPQSRHGYMLGINQSLNSICQILGPVLAGLLIAQAPAWVFGGAAAVIASLSLLIPRKPKEAQ